MIIIDKNAKREVQVKYPDRTRVLFPNLDDGYISSNDIVIPGINAPISDDGVSVASINDGAEGDVISKLVIGIEPVQDLHGQSNPYPAGGGKNKLPKGENISVGGITYSVADDGTIIATGTSTKTTFCNAGTFTLPAGSYVLNGCPVNSDEITMDIRDTLGGSGIVQGADSGSGLSFTLESETTGVVNIRIPSGVTVNNLVFKPMIRLSSVSDATFAPYENICPISGWTQAKVTRTGVNVWDEELEEGLINATTGENQSGTGSIRAKNYIHVFPNTTYYFHCGAGKSNNPYLYDANKNYIGRLGSYVVNGTFAIPANCHYMRFAMPGTYGATYNHDISINYPSTDHDYHTYNKQTVIIDLNGTIYGGTLDVTTGVLTVDMAIVDMGTLTWGFSTTADGVKCYYSDSIGSLIKPVASHSDIPDMICSKYQTFAWNSRLSITNGVSLLNSGQLRVIDSNYQEESALEDFTNSLSSVQLCYKLKTPTTVQLTPQEVTTLLGQNNIWADCGNVLELSYSANMNIRLQDLLNEKLDKPTIPGTLGQVLTSDGEGGQTWETPE